jgi:hypothetical protein
MTERFALVEFWGLSGMAPWTSFFSSLGLIVGALLGVMVLTAVVVWSFGFEGDDDV